MEGPPLLCVCLPCGHGEKHLLGNTPFLIVKRLSCFALTLFLLHFQFVVLLFWTIFVHDRELIYPASIDSFFPLWINHAMVCILCKLQLKTVIVILMALNTQTMVFSQHTLVLPVLLGEMLVQPHIYPQMKHALAAIGLVGSAYLFW